MWKILLCSVTYSSQSKKSHLEIRFLFGNMVGNLFIQCKDNDALGVSKSWKMFSGLKIWGQAYCLETASTSAFHSPVCEERK